MGQRVRETDWSTTPLGDFSTWPQSLRSSLSLVLNAKGIAALYWGPEQRLLYNDAYGAALGERHPWAFGRPMPEVLTDIAPILGPQVAEVLASGEGFAIENLSMVMHRHGRDEETVWTYSFSPVQGEAGEFASVLLLATETTQQVLAERRSEAAEAERHRLGATLKRQTEAAHGNEARLQALMEQSSAGIAQTTLDGRFIFVNDRYCSMVGHTREELLSLRMHALTHPEDLPDNAVQFKNLAQGGRSFEVQKRYLRPDGSTIWVRNNVTAVREADGEVASIFAVSIDITKQVEAEEHLRASERQLREVTDAVPILVAFVDRTLTYRFANAAYWEWFGCAPEDVVGRTIPDLTDTEGYNSRREAIECVLAGEAARLDLPWPWPDGRRRIADIRYIPRRGADGDIDGFYVFVQDVTALRDVATLLSERADTLVREVAERTADRNALWELSSDLMLRCMFNGVMTAVNPAWTALLGWREDELLGANLFDFIHPDDMAHTVEGAQELSEGTGHARFDNRYRHRDGSYRWISWSTRPADGLINAVGRDSTAEKDQAAALAKAEEALRQSQKMEAVGQLTGGLAHDFNNLLTGISGSLDLLQKRVAQGRLNDLDRYLIAAQGASKRAAALTHRLLAFSRRQTLDPKPTNVHKLVLGMTDLIRRTVGPEITVETVDMVGLWLAMVDPPQLENALLNLCINARDAMPDGGRITIETANRWMDDRTARASDVEPGQYLSLCVSDTGTGMLPDVAARAFDPFFTTKPLGQGTGLGLSMIYGFARQSGGQVRIYSEIGQGTMICIYLPRHYGEGDNAAQDIDHAEEGPRAIEGETVLVVDDEPTVRMLVTDVLGDLGYQALEAEDGASGLKILQSHARVDLLITDVGLPNGMNGRQVADAARVLRPGLKVLFITGYAENAAVGNGHLDPGMAVLTKPFAMDDLAAKIRTLIES